jgi:hypothetical protein
LAALDGGDGDDAHMHRGTHLHSAHHPAIHSLCVSLSHHGSLNGFQAGWPSTDYCIHHLHHYCRYVS